LIEKTERSKIGLSFVTGLIGAYFLSDSLFNLGLYFGLDEITSTTNVHYLTSIATGVITGLLVVIIPKTQKFRALLFVVGSLLLMDTIAFFGTAMPISDLINRMLLTAALSITGLITYLILKFFINPKKATST